MVKDIYSKIPGAQYEVSVGVSTPVTLSPMRASSKPIQDCCLPIVCYQGYIFPSSIPTAQLPVVKVDCGGRLIQVQKEDLSFADVGNGYTFGGIQPRGDLPFDILGGSFLKGSYVIFDVVRAAHSSLASEIPLTHNTGTQAPGPGAEERLGQQQAEMRRLI